RRDRRGRRRVAAVAAVGRSLSDRAPEGLTVWLPRFACPECGERVAANGEDGFVCPFCAAAFPRVQGIFRFMPPARTLSLEPFLRQYRAVRERDGFRASSPEYYRALPMVRRDDPRAAEWRIRRESY